MTQVVDFNKSQVPVCESAIIVPPPGITKLVEEIARMFAHTICFGVSEKGLWHEQKMLETYIDQFEESGCRYKQYRFLDISNPYHAYYLKRRNEHIAQFADGTLDLNIDLSHLDYNPPPSRDRPPPLKGFSIPAGITLKELGIIKLTAQFVARYGLSFWTILVNKLIEKPQFSFLMKKTDKNYSFHYGLVALYQRVLKPSHVLCEEEDKFVEGFYHCLQLEKLGDGDGDGDGDDEKKQVIDLHALVCGLDFFTHMDVIEDDDPELSDTIMPPPQPLSAMMMTMMMPPPLRSRESCVGDAQPDDFRFFYFPTKITLKELGIMKLTAQFVARYGEHFRRALMMRVLMNPNFEFMFFPKDLRPQFESMEPAEIRFHIFSKLVDVYSNILIPSKKVDASPATALCVFFLRLQLEKLDEEEGVVETATAMIDLHAFVGGSVDHFAHMDDAYYSRIMAPPERLSVMMNRPPHSSMLVLLPPPKLNSLSWDPVLFLNYSIPPWITPEELGITKLTAQFTSLYGKSFKRALMRRVSTEPRFDFMRSHCMYVKKVTLLVFGSVYSTVLKPSKKAIKETDDDCTTAMALDLFFHCLQLEKLEKKGVETTTNMIELNAFMSGVDYLTYMNEKIEDSATLPLPQRRSVMLNQVPATTHECVGERKPTLRPLLSFPLRCLSYVTPKQLVFIKLTALFAARYGMVFCRDLLKKVVLKPQYDLFKFLEASDTCFSLYNVVLDAYSKVVKASYDAYKEDTVLERFFSFLEWEEEEEGGETETAMVDLYAFVEGVDCFAQMEDDNYSALMGNHQFSSSTGIMQRVLTMPGKACRPPLPLPEEPEPKRQKLDESARVPEDQFSTIRVCVPRVDGEQVIEMRVKSFSEESLKEKIAAVVQVPETKGSS